jgi:hypothetical protein
MLPSHMESMSPPLCLHQQLERHENDAPVLLQYAMVAFERGKIRESLPLLIKALVTASKDDAVKRQFSRVMTALDKSTDWSRKEAQVLAGSVGARAILDEIHEAVKSSPALVFIAGVLKEVGAVRQACLIYERALEQMNDNNINLTLTLVHTQEVCALYQSAFDRIKLCMFAHRQLVIGGPGSSSKDGASLAVQSVLEVLTRVKNIHDPALRQGTAKCAAWQPVPRQADAGVCQVAVPKFDTELHNQQQGTAEPSASAASPAKSSPTTASSDDNADEEDSVSSSVKAAVRSNMSVCSYTSDQLDMLALMMTAVKILFCVGALQPISAVIALIGTRLGTA